MAYTQGVYEIDAETGKAAIYLVDPSNPGNRDPFLSPTSHLDRILWHSDLDYLEIFYDETATLSLPAITGVSRSVDHAWPDHDLGSIPYGGMIVDGIQQDGALTIQTANYGRRSLELHLTTSGTIVHEYGFRDTTVSLPAITVDVRVILFRVAPILDAANSFLIDPYNNILQFGFGKFSTNGNPKVRITSGTPDFTIPAIGRTIDSSGATLRIVQPDGSTEDYFGYSGSFTGPGVNKVVAT